MEGAIGQQYRHMVVKNLISFCPIKQLCVATHNCLYVLLANMFCSSLSV
jgi:hypothetical protein